MRYHPELEEELMNAQEEFVWEAPEYERRERSSRWYLIMGGVALVFVIYAIWTANILFAFIVLLAAIIIVLAGNEKPKKILVQIGHNGLVWDGEYLPFDDIRQFAIVYQPPHAKILYVYPRSTLRPRMRVYLGEQDPVLIREHLRQYVSENLHLRDEHDSDILAKLFRL